tara:strand:- start:199 stop:444 length:246 start_codon:yes stop_codon:yes gene_type:complete
MKADWKPIETAPKDGTIILGAYSSYAYGEIYCDYSIVKFSDGCWVAMADGIFAINTECDGRIEFIEPFLTHWDYLPEGPKE